MLVRLKFEQSLNDVGLKLSKLAIILVSVYQGNLHSQALSLIIILFSRLIKSWVFFYINRAFKIPILKEDFSKETCIIKITVKNVLRKLITKLDITNNLISKTKSTQILNSIYKTQKKDYKEILLSKVRTIQSLKKRNLRSLLCNNKPKIKKWYLRQILVL